MSARPPLATPRTLPRALLVLAAATSLGLDGGFRGCGAEGTGGGGPLPEGPPLECAADSDCEAPMCEDAVCVAGRCMTMPVTLDRDGDGQAAVPCGTDCDDTSSFVFRGAFEECDGLDNDCDGFVDEDAPARAVSYDTGADVLASAAVPELPGVLFASLEPTPGGPWALEVRWFDVGPSGAVAVEQLAELITPELLIVSVPVPGGARFVWASPADRRIQEATVTVTHDGTSAGLTVTPVTTVYSDLDVTEMVATEAVGGYALLLSERDPMDGTRRRSLAVSGAPRVPLPYVDGPFDLASRGTRFYTPAGDAELAVLDASGFELARVALPGPLGPEAVTGWSGRIFAVGEDAFDYTVREISADDRLADGFPLSGSGDVQLHPLASRLAVTRDNGSYLSYYLYDPELAQTEALEGFLPSFPHVTRRAMLETSEGPAVVASREAPSTSVVVVVGCRNP